MANITDIQYVLAEVIMSGFMCEEKGGTTGWHLPINA